MVAGASNPIGDQRLRARPGQERVVGCFLKREVDQYPHGHIAAGAFKDLWAWGRRHGFDPGRCTALGGWRSVPPTITPDHKSSRLLGRYLDPDRHRGSRELRYNSSIRPCRPEHTRDRQPQYLSRITSLLGPAPDPRLGPVSGSATGEPHGRSLSPESFQHCKPDTSPRHWRLLSDIDHICSIGPSPVQKVILF